MTTPNPAALGAESSGAKRGPRPLDEMVYGAVYDAILEHRLPPGTKLPEDSLAEAFGVSRTVVRRALSRLGQDNVVELRPNRGAVVASPTVEEARDVFATRRLLERAVIEGLTGPVAERDLEGLRTMVAEEGEAYRRGDRRTWIRLSGEFHLRLADLGGNKVIADFLKELVSRTSLIIAVYETPGQAACGFADHLALLDAIAAGKGAVAAALMETHLRDCETRLNLDQHGGSVNLSEVFGAPGEARLGRARRP